MLICYKPYKKMDWAKFFINQLIIIVGCLLVAFGTVVFQEKLNIVTGGLSGIGIVIKYFTHFDNAINVFVWIANAFFWIIGLIFLGKEFAFKTLLASIAYPGFLTIFETTGVFNNLATQVAGNGEVGNMMLCALFAGVCLGAGMSLTLVGGGSTGGFDTVILLAEKYLHIRSSITSICIDATVILIAMFAIRDNVVPSLCGIMGAAFVALFVEIVYLGNQSSYQADIISDHYEEISKFAQNELGRGATIITANGGYHGDPRPMLRVVFDKKQYDKFRSFIAQTDPHAFVTFTQTNAVFGEGFKKNFTTPSKRKKK